MSKKPATITINLLPKDPFFQTAFGRFLQWALSAGRYIVIFTELVVIVSFAARFTLDRQLTDLNSDIVKKRAVITSYGDLEERFKATQGKIEQMMQVQQDTNITDVFQNLSDVTPRDVEIDKLTITPSTVSIAGKVLSQSSFNLMINNLQLSHKFYNISVGKIESGQDKGPGFDFTLTANTKEVKKVAPKASTQVDKVNVLDRTEGL